MPAMVRAAGFSELSATCHVCPCESFSTFRAESIPQIQRHAAALDPEVIPEHISTQMALGQLNRAEPE